MPNLSNTASEESGNILSLNFDIGKTAQLPSGEKYDVK